MFFDLHLVFSFWFLEYERIFFKMKAYKRDRLKSLTFLIQQQRQKKAVFPKLVLLSSSSYLINKQGSFFCSVLSRQDHTSLIYKYLNLGATDYLMKPLCTDELSNLWMHKGRSRDMASITLMQS